MSPILLSVAISTILAVAAFAVGYELGCRDTKRDVIQGKVKTKRQE